MQLTPIATRTATPPPLAAPASSNPWGFPALDRDVAQGALSGLEAGARLVDRLIDRSIAVRVMLDRDLKAGSFSPDAVRAVRLLVDARDYALGSIEQRYLHSSVVDPVRAWIRASGDERLNVVAREIRDMRSAVMNLLDDEEGNVSETIADMQTNPGRRVWQSIRDGVDGAIANLYAARDISSSTHVLRAAGGLH